ncbi:MAG: DNA mismatch repair protein MutS [Salibacteraceae bacterium]
MKQYYAIKAKHPGALLLFRVGDFYETFGEDAIRASKILGIVLTQRKNGAASSVELAGFPHHSLEVYLPKLVRAGERVAICDQLEDPKSAKTIVKRGVTELVTPGVSFNEQLLDSRSNNFLAAVHTENDTYGLAFLDVSTGEFFAAQGGEPLAEKLLSAFQPNEIVYERSRKKTIEKFHLQTHPFELDEWAFQHEFALEMLTRQFGTISLKGFGIETMHTAIAAAGAVLHYLSETQHDRLRHINRITRIDLNEHMWLDGFTQRNLELFESPHKGGKSLLDVIDQTVTAMGSRMLRQWLSFPLIDKAKIEERLDAVTTLINNEKNRTFLREQLKSTGDLERVVSRLSIGKISPKECLQLAKSLEAVFALEDDRVLLSIDSTFSKAIADCKPAASMIRKTIHPEAPAVVSKGNVIANGIDDELDDLRYVSFKGKDKLIEIQTREIEHTGISSLKIGYNNVFGYYLEVTNAHKEKVPNEWVRKQTLVNAERYITEELKAYEQKILTAEERIGELEQQLYTEFLGELSNHIPSIQRLAKKLAWFDCVGGFAELALNRGYCRPTIETNDAIEIEAGRHPVIECEMPLGEAYIPNNILLNKAEQQIIMLTGPNMSGKSAVLRQCALTVIMAQMGSYVPAQRAKIGIKDKVFTRVGASDNISQGESTFMVEMNETASILNNLSQGSLILLDEIGRGTSTYDGISIAWSIAEYLHEHPTKALTLFATHYHELNEMASLYPRIKNFTIAIRETDSNIVFLRKLIPGGSEHSFGIHVARMAGMPRDIVDRAKTILKKLEDNGIKNDSTQALSKLPENMQLSIFQLDDPVLSQIRDELIHIDINSLTPVEALFKLNEIKKLLGKANRDN